MTSHRPPPPARTPRVVWVIAAGAAVGIVGPPVVALAQTVAPQVAAQTALAFPEQTPEPVGHGGLGGPLVIPSIGASGAWEPEATAAETTRPRPPQRPQEPLRTVGGSTDTQPTVSGAPSDKPAAATATPVEATTPPTTTEAAVTTQPEPTDTSEPTTEPSTTASDTTTTATTEETDVTGTSGGTP